MLCQLFLLASIKGYFVLTKVVTHSCFVTSSAVVLHQRVAVFPFLELSTLCLLLLFYYYYLLLKLEI